MGRREYDSHIREEEEEFVNERREKAQKQKKRRSLDKVEKDIEACEERIQAIEMDMANPEFYADGAKMQILQRDLERAKAELKVFEAEWEEHAE